MRNEEQIEMELTQLKGKKVGVIIPLGGMVSLSVYGELYVVDVEHRVGFHIPSFGYAVIFFASDVEALEATKSNDIAKTIRLLPLYQRLKINRLLE